MKELLIWSLALASSLLSAYFFVVAALTMCLPKGAWEMMRKQSNLIEWYYGGIEKRRVMRELHRQHGDNLVGKIYRPKL